MDDQEIVALWDFGQPTLSEQRFRAALAQAEADQRAVDAVLLRTQVARCLGLQSRFTESGEELDLTESAYDALDAAAPLARAYIDLERGRMHRSNGDPATAEPLFLKAYKTAGTAGLESVAVDAAHMMAVVGDADSQLEWAERALGIARQSTDAHTRRWIGSVENNLGWSLHGLGRFEEAQEHFDRALAANEERGDPERIRIAHWTVARGLRSLGRYDEALSIQRRLADEGPEDMYVEEELAELLTALGHPDQAAEHAEKARQLS